MEQQSFAFEYENKQFSQSYYLYVYRKTEEISKQVLGWRNSVNNTNGNKNA